MKISKDPENYLNPNDADSVKIVIDGGKRKKTPKLVATAYTSRHSGFYVFNAFFLIFLITASTLSGFSIDVKSPQSRLQITYTILLASISFKWVINRTLPPVSYLTFLDTYSIICIVFINVLAGYHAVISRFHSVLPQDFDEWMLVVFVAGFILLQVFSYSWYLLISKKKRILKRDEKKCISYFLEKSPKNNSLLLAGIEENEADEYD